MAINVSATLNTINVSTTLSSISVTDPSSNIVVSNISNGVSNVTVDSTLTNVVVTGVNTVSNVEIRQALSAENLEPSVRFGNVTYYSSNGVIQYKGITADEITGEFSAVDAGGDGSLAYNNLTGVFTYNGPGNSDYRGALSNTSPITYNSSTGVIGIDSDAIFTGKDTDDLPQGSNNIYFSTSGATVNTDALPEGSANLYFTNARSRSAISTATGSPASGGGSLSYNSTTGVLTFTPADTDVAAFLLNTDPVVLGGNLEMGGDRIIMNIGNTGTGNNFLIVDTSSIPGNSGNAAIFYNSSTKQWRFQNNSAITHAIPTSTTDLNEGSKLYLNVSGTTDDLAEGSANLWYTTARTNSAISAYTGGLTNLTGNVTTTASVVGAYLHGDGSNITGLPAGYSNANVTAFFGDSANFPFTFNGNIQVQGNIDYVNVEDLLVNDQSITLNYGNVAQDAFIYIDRPSENNAHIKWNETSDQWEIYDGTSTYVIPRSTSDLTEGTNLYFTNARANAAIDARVTSITANVDSVNGLTGVVSLDTDDIPEGAANLYYTDARVDSHLSGGYGITYTAGVIETTNSEIQAQANVAIGNNTTDNLAEGSTNLYFNGKDTDDLPEGTANLYFTTARANSAIDDYVVGGTGITVTSGTIDLDDTAVTPKTYGSATLVPQFTVDQQGRITAVTNVTIAGGGGEGTVTSVTAGAGMTQTGNANLDPTLNVVGGFGITVNADNIEWNNTSFASLTSPITTTANITAGYFIGDGSLLTNITAGNVSGTVDQALSVVRTVIAAENLAKGDAVAITGGTGDNPEVSKALASNASLMPAFGIMLEAVTATNIGTCLIYGELTSVDMGTFPVGDEIFVSATTAGALSNVAPATEANLLQKIGKVIKSGSGGKLTVQGAGRTNATPNLDNGKIFIGNGSDQQNTATLDTSIVPENGNLYFTTARANSAIDDYVSGGYGITYASGVIETTNSEIQAQANVAIGNNSNIVLTDQDQTITGVKTFESGTVSDPAVLMNDTALALDANTSNRDRIEIQGAYDIYVGPDINIKKARGNISGIQSTRSGDLVFNFLSSAANAVGSYHIGGTFGFNFSNRNIRKTVSGGTAQDIYFGGNGISSIISPTLKIYGGTNDETRFPKQAVAEQELVSQGTLRVGNSDYPATGNIANSVFTIGRQDTTANITLSMANDNNSRGDNWASGAWANSEYSFGIFSYQGAVDDSIVLPINVDDRDFVAIPNGTAITLDNFTGNLTNLNGNVRYTKLLSNFIENGYSGAYLTSKVEYYELYDTPDLAAANVSTYPDFGITAPGGSGIADTSNDVLGTVEFSAVPNRGSGTTARDYTFTLPASTNDMVLTTNGSDVATFYANTDVEFHGNVIGVGGSGTVTSIDVAGGDGLTSTGGPITTSGTITVNVGAGDGITVNADDVAVDATVVRTTGDFSVAGTLTTSNVNLKQFQETVVALGNQSGDLSTVADFNAANASIFTLTATGGLTISSIPNAQAGSSYTIKITQDGTGSHALTSTFKYVGGDKTLSTAPNAIDVISVVYDGTDYLASLTKAYA